MHIWRLKWNLPHLLFGLYLHIIIIVASVSLACSDKVPEQLATVMNCSKHERHTRNYDYMEGGDVRIRRLFSGTQWFLTIDDSGNISGTQDPKNCYSILEIRTVSEGGVLAIKGVKSQYYISMNRTGMLRGKVRYSLLVFLKALTSCTIYYRHVCSMWLLIFPKMISSYALLYESFQLFALNVHPLQKEYSDSCNFKEVFLENFYSAYSSAKWTKQNGTEMFIALSRNGKPLRGRRTRKEHPSSHFLPRECKEDDKHLD
ncbi:fibroblast growth factor 7 isoform X1 [Denticeps clupeoides]|uniref:fibroblast growth factor 7 isoform X1 n=1 Tax=Denticeps clupeoides TaxID=299321 RepID=UPI0010A3A8C3|nr:fibroblast growth factor 7 isoform X1 [Denticeps clupeoides]